ncbi:MAG TPA: putative sulfate/molybdate transporter [Terriglobales bacterium]|nr:putative sulfate/molybdate transporter [Terriglobales bacterium]
MPPGDADKTRAAWPLSRLDIAGAFGDIGVLFPIAIALITLNHLNATAVFLAAGLAYVVAGWYFRIPMSVQPFKAVAAISLALGLTPQEIATAGLLIGVLLAIIAVTGLAGLLARLFTLPVVRGIQLGLGLLLAREGIRLIFGTQASLSWGSLQLFGWEIAAAAAVILLLFIRSERFPAGLVLLGFGIVLGLAASGGGLRHLEWRPLPLSLIHVQGADMWRVLPLLVIPQFALTFGNSIVASENTAHILYGRQADRVTIRSLAGSIAVVNVASAAILGSPLCHGSGGITAHFKFGARTQKSNYVIGAICLLLAAIGTAAVAVLRLIPFAVLGVLLIYVGIQHALYLRDIARRLPWLLIALAVGIVAVLTTNLTWGFLVGLVLQTLVSLRNRAAPVPGT